MSGESSFGRFPRLVVSRWWEMSTLLLPPSSRVSNFKPTQVRRDQQNLSVVYRGWLYWATQIPYALVSHALWTLHIWISISHGNNRNVYRFSALPEVTIQNVGFQSLKSGTEWPLDKADLLSRIRHSSPKENGSQTHPNPYHYCNSPKWPKALICYQLTSKCYVIS